MKEIHRLCSKCLKKEREVKRGLLLTHLFGVFYFIALNYLRHFFFKSLLGSVDYIPYRSRLHPIIRICLFIKGVLLTSAMTGDLKDSKAIFPIRINVAEAKYMQALRKAHSLNA